MFQEATQQLLAGNKVSIAQQATSQGTAAEMSIPLEMWISTQQHKKYEKLTPLEAHSFLASNVHHWNKLNTFKTIQNIALNPKDSLEKTEIKWNWDESPGWAQKLQQILKNQLILDSEKEEP